MIDYIIGYLLVGFIWMTLWDLGIQKMPNNGTRIRYFFFWPFTLIAFIIGFIESWNKHSNERE
tara:strand:+ start:195 stop:383 length:189 start_codon:yes stop_codon:yes gene_type:complete